MPLQAGKYDPPRNAIIQVNVIAGLLEITGWGKSIIFRTFSDNVILLNGYLAKIPELFFIAANCSQSASAASIFKVRNYD